MDERNRKKVELNLWKALYLETVPQKAKITYTIRSPSRGVSHFPPETKKIVICVSVPGGCKEMSSILLTNSALLYEPKCGGRGEVAGSQPMNTAVHRSPNKLWRSNSIFN
jgi:hypothetical protein